MSAILRFVVAVGLVVGPVGTAVAQTDSGATVFLRWASGALHSVAVDSVGEKVANIAPLLEMIGPVPLVAFSEATHSGDEVLRFRNALFLALARERGFRALAIESGLSEGERLHTYVRIGSEPLASAVDSGFTWTFHHHRANRQLLQSLRAYNAAGPRDTVALYGFDVPGSPGNTAAVRGVSTALEAALAYLRQVDEAAYRGLEPRVAGFVGSTPKETYARYGTLELAERDRFSGAIADLIGLLERRATRYTEASSAEAFAWGHRHAVGARQVDTWLRLLPVNDRPDNYAEHHAYRDWAMADNIDWIRSREGPNARLMIFASRFHIAGAPVLVSSPRISSSTQGSITLGSHLRARYGDRVVLIGNIFGRSAVCPPSRPSTVNSLDRLLPALGVRSFVLDLRQAPPAVRAWLDRLHALDESFTVNPAQAFDIIYYNQIDPPSCRP